MNIDYYYKIKIYINGNEKKKSFFVWFYEKRNTEGEKKNTLHKNEMRNLTNKFSANKKL